MRHRLVLAIAVACGVVASWRLWPSRSDETVAAQPATQDVAFKSATLEQLCDGKLKIVDLGWPLSERGAYWPAENYRPFELRTIATLEKNGVNSKAFSMPEHEGTHLDAPNHFEARGVSVDQIPVQDFFAPGVVIDVERQATADADYRLNVSDIEDWERKNGEIPKGAVVLLNSGWGKQFMNAARYRNQDGKSVMHFPGFSADAVKFLVDRRKVRGIGVDTLSVDYGPSRDFPVHHLLGRAGCYGLENLAALDKLPARNFFVVVAPIKIETGTGGPARVWAIVP